MPPLADPIDLQERLGFEPDDRAVSLLEDASALVRAAAGQDYLNDDGTLAEVPPVLVTITLRATMRAYSNPEGLRQRSLGDSAKTYETATPYLTAAEKREIQDVAGVSAMGSITLEAPWPVPIETEFIDVVGGEPMPYR